MNPMSTLDPFDAPPAEATKPNSWQPEPLAVVGMACRFPDAPDVAAYWSLLLANRSTVRRVPADRWSPTTADAARTQGAWLDGVYDFDAGFFGLTAADAATLDPQQRLLLMLAVHALQDARLPRKMLANQRVGVFTALGPDDHALATRRPLDALETAATWDGTAAERMAQAIGSRGPTVSVEAGSAGALVALHLASKSLLDGESDLVLVGSVSLLLDASSTLALSQTGRISPDGHCKPFSTQANGYGRGEGGGVLVLMRSQDAQVQRRRIYGVMRASAVNHRGVSGPLTPPHGASQAALIRDALALAQLRPEHIDYLEAQGLGDPLADMAELIAAKTALGHPQRVLALGAVSSQINHLDAAAGLASAVKVLLALHHGVLPPTQLDGDPQALLDDPQLALVTTVIAWPSGDAPRRAGVNASSHQGTQAHVIFEEAPPPRPMNLLSPRPLLLLPLSARSDEALAQLTADYDATIAHASAPAVACSAALTRDHEPRRRVVLGDSAAALRHALHQPYFSQASVESLAFVFSGQGSQYAGMGQQLYHHEPIFRREINAMVGVFRPLLDADLREVLWGDHTAQLDNTRYTQPALFMLESALAKLWMHWGVIPQVVAGYGVGELIAAYLAGVFSLTDAARLVATRGALMHATEPGGMATVKAEPSMVEIWLADFPMLHLAAVDNDQQCTVAGPLEALELLVFDGEQRGIFVKRCAVAHAFQSPLMAPAAATFRAVAQTVRYDFPHFTVISGVTGKAVHGELTHSDYWVEQITRPIQWYAVAQQLHAEAVIEIGPQPVLIGAMRDQNRERLTLPSLRRHQDDLQVMLESLGRYYAAGGAVDWERFYQHHRTALVDLPLYPFAQQSYRPTSPVAPTPGTATMTLLGERWDSPITAWHRVFSPQQPPYLEDLRQDHRPQLSVAVYAAWAAEAAYALGYGAVTHLAVVHALVLVGPVAVHTHADGDGDAMRLVMQAKRDGQWQPLAIAQLTCDPPPAPLSVGLATNPQDVGAVYAALYDRGFPYGPSACVLKRLAVGNAPDDHTRFWATGFVQRPTKSAAEDTVGFHATLLEGAVQALMAALPADHRYQASQVTRWQVIQSGKSAAQFALQWRFKGNFVYLDGDFFDDDRRPIAHLRGLRLQALVETPLPLYRPSWQPLPPPLSPPAAATAVDDEAALPLPRRVVLIGEAAALARATPSLVAADITVLDLPLERFDGADVFVPSADDCVFLAAGDDPFTLTTRLLHLIQALHRQPSRLLVVTQQAHAISPTDEVNPAHAALWGMTRVLAAEQPELHPRLWDGDAPLATNAAWLLAALDRPDGVDQIAHRDGQDLCPRLVALPSVDSAPDPEAAAALSPINLTISPERSYLLLGGLSDLGAQWLEFLVTQGAARVVVASLQPPSEALMPRLTAWRRQVEVEIVLGDATQPAGMQAALARAAAAPHQPLAGIVHTAGGVEETLFTDQTHRRLAQTLRSAVTLTNTLWHELDRADAGATLDFWVMCGTAAATLGLAGEGAQAAADGALAALAAQGRRRGWPMQFLALGPWRLNESPTRYDLGWLPFIPAQSQRLFTALATDHHGLTAAPTLAVLPLNWVQFAAQFPATWPRHPLPIHWRDLAPVSPVVSWRDRFIALPLAARRDALVRHLQPRLAQVLGIADSGDRHTTLNILPLAALRLRQRLEQDLDQPLSAALFAATGDIATLADTLAHQLPPPPTGDVPAHELTETEMAAILAADLESAAATDPPPAQPLPSSDDALEPPQ